MKINCWILFCLFFYACAAQNREIQEAAPCDPQPPCLPVKSQSFGFSFEWDTLKPIHILTSIAEGGNSAAEISVLHLPAPNTYFAEITQPNRLQWKDNQTFKLFLDKASGRIDTLTLKVSEQKIDCCPQYVVHSVYYNGKLICRNAEKNGPVNLRN